MTNSEKLKELHTITIVKMREYSANARELRRLVELGQIVSTDHLALQDNKFRDFRDAMNDYNALLRAITSGKLLFDGEYTGDLT